MAVSPVCDVLHDRVDVNLRIVIDSICGLLCPKLDVDAEAEANMALLRLVCR